MKSSRFSEEQMTMALRQAEAGTPVAEVCRKLHLTEQAFYRWKKKYGLMDEADAKRLKALEKENSELKKPLADQLLKTKALEIALEKNLQARSDNGRRPLAKVKTKKMPVIQLPDMQEFGEGRGFILFIQPEGAV